MPFSARGDARLMNIPNDRSNPERLTVFDLRPRALALHYIRTKSDMRNLTLLAALTAAILSCASAKQIGVTNPAEVVHVAPGYGKLRVVSVDNQRHSIGGMNREYFVTGPGEHTLELQMFGFYQSTSNATVKIRAKAGDFVLLCPVKDITPFAKTGTWGVLALADRTANDSLAG